MILRVLYILIVFAAIAFTTFIDTINNAEDLLFDFLYNLWHRAIGGLLF